MWNNAISYFKCLCLDGGNHQEFHFLAPQVQENVSFKFLLNQESKEMSY
jgi:hypothetical protein